MNISQPFIARPVATSLIMIGVMLLGLVAFFRLPIASLPSVERPTIVINAPFPGASPTTVATALTQPLGRSIGLIPGITEMYATSELGSATIVVQFELQKSVDAAYGAVQAAMKNAAPDLPKGPWPPYAFKANPNGFAPILLAMTSDVVPMSEVYNLADSVVSPKLSELPGVARVYIYGAERHAVRIQVRPDLLASMNLSLERVRLAIVAASQNRPKGALAVDAQRYTIEADDQLLWADDYRDLVVAWRNGAPVRLADIALITDGVINGRVAGWFGTSRAVILYVYKQPDANVVETVDAVKALIPQFEHWLPPAIKLHTVYDRTTLIRASVRDVEQTLLIAVVLVIVIIAVFLKRLAATMIPSVTIPVSLAATLAAMYLCDFSLDNLSLMALTIAAGFVVDDAVIVIENVIRRMEQGETALQAAIAGSRQMGFTVISVTAALVAALIPVLFMPDIVGRYFLEFGATLVIAIIGSALVSLTLTPMLCSRWLVRDEQGAPSSQRNPSWPMRAYARSLDWALHHRVLSLLATLTLTGASVWLYLGLPKSFMPTQDTGVMLVRTVAQSNISFPAMEDRQRTVGELLLSDPAVSGLTSYISDAPRSIGFLVVALKSLESGRPPIQQVIQRLRERTARIDGVRVFFIPLQDLNVGAQGGSARYQYSLWGTDETEVHRAGEAMVRRFRTLPGVIDVVPDWETGGLQAGLTISRARAASLGVTPFGIDNTLNDAFGQRQVNLLYFPTNFARVIYEIDPSTATDPSIFTRLYVPSATGAAVPMAALTTPKRAHSAMWEHHSSQFPARTISFDVKPGAAPKQVLDAIRGEEAAVRLPDGVSAEFRGEAREVEKSPQRQIFLFVAAIITIYLVLGMLYESYVHPLTILSTLPSTAFGALLALKIVGLPFSLITTIACILVVGLVMKNAIMMVDFAIELQRHEGYAARDAISSAAAQRLRPIVMTTLTGIFSALPIAFGTGPGHELRQPLGIAIVGGLIVAQVFTLFTTPVIYMVMDRVSRARSLASPVMAGRQPAPAA
ncbi:efflux RND transporter permease subunit [Bradyrhizobium ontarionense]|uniref:Efflux RND transporter permease subunit n=1 Tax=Bradyrhizobium ontarionense TaxID=2898149 RepID=A0ABY3RBL7_9BRAD|nr:efflux RND transporter permease subunit [Bradyrhizobium sp. A19]UFZ04765.1 efflux RND transporter permease subunit [Bradyrhizobium sp. A19]